MKTLKITEYLSYVEISDTGKTKVIGVGNNSGDKLGIIKWRSGWRKYVFEPETCTVWDAKCLTDIITFLNELMDSRK